MNTKRAAIYAIKQVPVVTPPTAKSPPESLVDNFTSPSLPQLRQLMMNGERVSLHSTAAPSPYEPEAKKLKQEYALGLDSSILWEEEAMKVAAADEDAMLLLNASKATAKNAGLETKGITPNDVQDAQNEKKITLTDEMM